ncbi:hypothetical protein K0M31_014224, partial [Melipona bicolor]
KTATMEAHPLEGSRTPTQTPGVTLSPRGRSNLSRASLVNGNPSNRVRIFFTLPRRNRRNSPSLVADEIELHVGE